jgi:hypothetical protein
VKTGFKNSLRLQILFAVVVASLSVGCSLCGNDEVLRVSSPDAKLEAVVFQRDCGATTGFSTQISIVAKGTSLPNSGGNVYVADTDHGKAPSAKWGGPEVDVLWTGQRTVKVVTHPNARVFHNKTAISVSTGIFSRENVKAEYVLKSP